MVIVSRLTMEWLNSGENQKKEGMYIPTSRAPPTTLQCTNFRGTLSLNLICGDKTRGVGCVGEIKVQISSVRVSDEGLTLEASAFQIFQGGNSTFTNSFDKTKFSWDQNGLIAAAKDAFTYWYSISTHRENAKRHEILHDMCGLLINTDITFHYITTPSSVILAVFHPFFRLSSRIYNACLWRSIFIRRKRNMHNFLLF